MIKTCTYCKKEFEAKRVDKHYCSGSCRQLNHLQRKAVEMFGINSKEDQNVKTSIDILTENVKTDEQNAKKIPKIFETKKGEPKIIIEKEFNTKQICKRSMRIIKTEKY